MSELVVVRHKNRRGLMLPQQGTRANPTLLFPLDGVERSELDELIRGILAKQGVTGEAEIQAIVEKAEQSFEIRQKVYEARKEVRRLLAIRRAGGKLMQVGFRKWRQVWFPPVRRLKGLTD